MVVGAGTHRINIDSCQLRMKVLFDQFDFHQQILVFMYLPLFTIDVESVIGAYYQLVRSLDGHLLHNKSLQ
jgi:hypothetical protein